MEVSWAVALRGPTGWLYIPPADRQGVVWLTNEVPACRALPWCGSKEERTPSSSEVRHARRGSHCSRWTVRRSADDGSDDRERPAQGLAYCGGDQCWRGAPGQGTGTGLRGPGRAAAGAGAGVAGTHLRGRGRYRAGASAGPAAGRGRERVLDIQPKLAARIRVLEAGNTSKNDPNDAQSVAVAALRSRTCREVTADDHAAVLRMRSRRHQDLGQSRNQIACRLHAVLCDLVPGGLTKEITAAQAAAIIEQAAPACAVGQARHDLAAELLADLRRLDAQMAESKKKLDDAVKASGTSVTGLFGVGPVVAAIVIGDASTVTRFPTRDHFAAWNATAPVEVSSGGRKIYRLSLRGNRRVNYRHPRRRGHPDPVQAQPRPLPPCRRQGDGHTRLRGRPEAHVRWPPPSARRPPHAPRKRPTKPLDTKRIRYALFVVAVG